MLIRQFLDLDNYYNFLNTIFDCNYYDRQPTHYIHVRHTKRSDES